MAFLESEPELDAGALALAEAYAVLSTCRMPIGMGIGPIRWDAMMEWCDRAGLEPDVAKHVVRVLRIVDAETLRRARQAATAPPKK